MSNITWLTKEAYNRLQIELDELKGPVRSEIAKKIEAARQEGDLKENGGYHAAREEQGKNEARIAQLNTLLLNAKVADTPADTGIVSPGMCVTADIAGEVTKFLLGSREVSVADGFDVFSERSPLGQAINGLKEGSETSYLTPHGKKIVVKVLEVKPYKE